MNTTKTLRQITINGTEIPAGTTVRAKISNGTENLVLVSYNGQSKYFHLSPVEDF